MTAPRARGSEKSPDAFRTISEVSDDLEVPQHVLRFWETRFTQLKPMKRGGGRRLYRPDHVALLRGIKSLLYDDGLTIKGVQKVLRESGSKAVIARGRAGASLSLEMREPEDAQAILPMDVPEDAANRLAALKQKVGRKPRSKSTTALPMATDAAPRQDQPDLATIKASITRLEHILAALEAPRAGA